jgi:hypothetical protein
MAAPGYFLCVISPTSALVKWLHANSSSFWERLRTAAESSRVCLDRASGTRCHPCRPLCRLHALFADGRIAEAGCWAHVRRKFFDVHAATGARIAKEALDRIGQFYGVEETINGRRQSNGAENCRSPRRSSAGCNRPCPSSRANPNFWNWKPAEATDAAAEAAPTPLAAAGGARTHSTA